MTTYFGFAISDSMFSETVSAHRHPMSPAEFVSTMGTETVIPCINPSHTATITAMTARYGVTVEVPAVAPVVELMDSDSIIVMSVRGLPRLADRHEYTKGEIDNAVFKFGRWTVGSTG